MPPYTTTELTSSNENSEFAKISKAEYVQSIVDTPKKPETYKCFLGEFQTRLIWFNIIAILALHVYALYLFIIFPWTEKPLLITYAFVIGGIAGFGITAGAHRLWTHRSYKAKLPLKILLILCYSMAGQNKPHQWVRDHRVHHKFSETDADPHNSNRGFFFAHVGWLMMKRHPEMVAKGKTVDCSDVLADPLMAFFEKYFSLFKLVCCFIIPSILPPLWWNEEWGWSVIGMSVMRYVVSLHCTWAVNSAAHLWGNRPYDKKIQPVECAAVAFIAIGEGWHNYHHTFPWDYKTAELGRLNVTKFWLDLFAKIGWAYDMKSPSPELVMKMIQKNGDGSHWQWGQKEITEEEANELSKKLS